MASPPCRFSAELRGFTLDHSHERYHVNTIFHSNLPSLLEAKQTCLATAECAGVLQKNEGAAYQPTYGHEPKPSPTGGAAWVKLCESARCEIEHSTWYWGVHIRTVPHLESVDTCCDASD